jgi:succinate dehydrogenase/fumarate reductase cytochrome b subunit
VFVWVFHRISGVLLIALLSVQLLTGLMQTSSWNAEAVKTSAALHKHALLTSLLVLLVIFHSSYGVRTILLDLGIRREKLLFWVCTVGGALLFFAFLICYFRHSSA